MSDGSLASADWVQLGFGSARRGFNPLETVLGPANVSTLTPLWTANAGGCEIACPPAPSSIVAGGRVFVGATDVGRPFEALDAATGALSWSASIGGVETTAAAASGLVFVPVANTFYALDAQTGSVRWSYNWGGSGVAYSAPAVVGKVVYVSSNGSTLFAFDALTGHVRWSVPGGGSSTNPASVAGGIVYAPTTDGKVRAFYAATGDPSWTFDGGSELAFRSIAVAGGRVFAGWLDGTLRALDATTGVVLWTVDTHGSIITSTAVANGIVYFQVFRVDRGHRATLLVARKASTGRFLWSAQIDCCNGNPLPSTPAVANGVVYTGAEGGFLAFDAVTGAALWSATGLACELGQAVVTGGRLYGNCDGDVRAFALPTSG